MCWLSFPLIDSIEKRLLSIGILKHDGDAFMLSSQLRQIAMCEYCTRKPTFLVKEGSFQLLTRPPFLSTHRSSHPGTPFLSPRVGAADCDVGVPGWRPMIGVEQLVTVKVANIGSSAWNVRYFIHYFTPLTCLMAGIVSLRCREQNTEHALWNSTVSQRNNPKYTELCRFIVFIQSLLNGVNMMHLLMSAIDVSFSCVEFFCFHINPKFDLNTKAFLSKGVRWGFSSCALLYNQVSACSTVSSSYKMTGWTLQKPLRSWH